MNRLVIIGNGFDLAHGLKTSYKDFIDWYWEQRVESFSSEKKVVSEDCLCTFLLMETSNSYSSWRDFAYDNNFFKNMDGSWKIPAKDVIGEIVNNHKSFTIKKSPFFENITKSIKTNGWVDIEMEYYKRLKEYVRQDMNYHSLNKQLHFLQNKLVQYLETQKRATKNNAIDNYLYSSISLDDLCVNARYLDRKIDSFMFLSFNYTDTVELYTSLNTKINYIHGSLYNPEEIIFGYGDELDKDYQNIIDMNDNELLRYVKSVKYLEANHYKEMLRFIETEPFQVFIMGHSCGNSDRTLLNKIFEHKNCVSIKPFYYQKPDGTDNYLEIVQNIYRNFTNMSLYRERVVSKPNCIPLPQSQKQ